MGFYSRHVAPRIVDTACSPSSLGRWRSRCVEGLSGTVIEIGFGGGRNLPYYPTDVKEIWAVEPSPVMRRRSAARREASPCEIRWVGLDGQDLDLDDDTVDHAVVTFSLCTIPDPARALRELRRVVRPGGELRVLEHGLAPDPAVQSWQHRCEPFEKVIADGCHLTRDPQQLVADNGWNITSVFQRYTPGPKPWTFFTSLRAL